MSKVYVGDIILREKIIINKDQVEDIGALQAAYTYDNGQEIFTTLEETDSFFLVPSNSYHKLAYSSATDLRTSVAANNEFKFFGNLRPEQEIAENEFFKKGRVRPGILQAPCGWGKTYTGSSLIARAGMPTVVLVHTKLLFNQWIESIKELLHYEPGMIGDGHESTKELTVAIYKSLPSRQEAIKNNFSMVIVDEAHLCPADMFSTTVNNFNSRYKIGITATPRRKDGKHVFLSDFFTPYQVTAIDNRQLDVPIVKIMKTDFPFVLVDIKRDWARQLNALAQNQNYIQYIATEANRLIKTQNRKLLILSERLDMLRALEALIPRSAMMVGSTPNTERDLILDGLGPDFDAILSTKIFDEGISCNRLDTILLTCPNNNVIKLEQRIGRIIREHPDKNHPLVMDFWLKGPIVERQQNNRYNWYKQEGFAIV